jgi:hypothetical protein
MQLHFDLYISKRIDERGRLVVVVVGVVVVVDVFVECRMNSNEIDPFERSELPN